MSLKVDRTCLGPKENPCGAISCEGSDFPVCASNNVTYISIEAMWCINRRKRLSNYFNYLFIFINYKKYEIAHTYMAENKIEISDASVRNKSSLNMNV